MRRIPAVVATGGALALTTIGLTSAAPTDPAEPGAVPGPPPRAVPTDGADPDATVVSQQPVSTVFEPPPGVIAGNPFVDTFDGVDASGAPTRVGLLSWQSNEDVATAASDRTLVRSTDGGWTFPEGYQQHSISGWYRKLDDGDVLGVEFVPDAKLDDHRVRLLQKRSHDAGRTWRTEHPVFTTDRTFATSFDRGIRVHRDILQEPDGDLLMTYYTQYAGESAGTSELAISHDEGRSWARYATVFPPIGNRTFNETGISWTSDGDLVAVARSHVGSTLDALYTARSSDQGRTWTAPQPLQLTTAGGGPAPATGVMPVLHLLPNGVLTLTFGRPDNWIAVSPDGSGRTFEQAQLTYQNFPEQDTGAFQRTHGSSGNGAHAVVGPHRVLVVGDNCAPSWGCPATDDGWTVDGRYRVWKKLVDVLGPDVGRLDLLSKVRSGAVRTETDMTSRDRHLPETGPLGALDGSTDPASAAVRRGRSEGRYTLHLDHAYALDRIGLQLAVGRPGSATVEVSTDGSSWQQVADTGPQSTWAMRYLDLPDVPARHVRITVHDPAPHPVATLGEVELYSTTDSFENDAVGYVPRGYTDAVGATVTDIDTHGDAHALRLADAWNDAQARATWVSDPVPHQRLEFSFQSMGYPRSLTFSTLGTTADGTQVEAYQLAVQASGLLARYDAATRTWTPFTTADQAIAQKEWHQLAVDARPDGADVYLDGVLVRTVPPSRPGVAAFTGHRFATSGTTPSYDNFVIDDVTQS
jgi:hypothetical protein